jgi:predicted RecB family nuclease
MKHLSGSFFLAATDLANHLGCNHLTQLNRLVALEELRKPEWNDPSLAILAKRGEEHEAAYVEYLKSKGLSTLNLKNKSIEATLEAMHNGVDVITQAKLENGSWMGYADILLKVPGESKFGNWSYEIQDTKLAQDTRASTILQLCLYTDMLGFHQGVVPKKMYVIKPGIDFPEEGFFYTEFQAYYRLIKKNLEQVMASPALPTYPNPVSQCDICRWWKYCDTRRHDDDHLSLVAGIRSLHIGELKRQKIETLTQFAQEPKPLREKPDRGNIDSYESIQKQAKIQLKGRIQKKLLYELLPAELNRGFARLPEPTKGDIYFDIEGDPFYDQGGLEYLLGFSFIGKEGNMEYSSLWALDRTTEKAIFEQFIDFVMARWTKYPNLSIYHYGIYEPSAVKRLTGRHATRSVEVDKLLRGVRFIDLHAIIKEGLKASVERYSLKDLEGFTSYKRKIDLPIASASRRSLECALELNEISSLAPVTRQIVQDYNEDDCLATKALHQWLETLRTELIEKSNDVKRPELLSGDASDSVQGIQTRAQSLYEGLVDGLPDDKTDLTEEQNAKWLLANLVDYFRRENKSAWWEYYRLHDLDHEELLDERKAITGLQFVATLPLKGKERNPTHQYKFLEQEVGIEEGDSLIEVQGQKIGTVTNISQDKGTIDIKKTKDSINIHPFSVHAEDVVNPEPLASSLFDLAENIIWHGMDSPWPDPAAKNLLLKKRPNLNENYSGRLLLPGEDVVVGAVRIATNLNKSVLAIQGPPGSGKTYTGAMMIIELAKQGKRIGVTAVSHKVIRNLFNKANELAKEKNYNVQFVHKPKEKSINLPDGIEEVDDNKKALGALDQGKVVGGTAWLWASSDSREKLDYLFVDEAGQMSLSFVLAASRSAKNLILLGDPQQLEQPQRGAHPEGADIAALNHLLDGKKTIPDDKGLFLETTRRLHPEISKFTSEVFYESRLKSLPGLEKQLIGGNTLFDGSGLFYVPVEHYGNQNKSVEEINGVTAIVERLLTSGTLTSEKGETRPLRSDDILIVAPYNAQVAALKERLPNISIGTVDKFQGQEGAVVIYSMTSSSAEDAPRGMGFIFNPNRLNVATSRAKSVCILVASPKLLEPECKTIDQMRWANALCRFEEMSTTVVSKK